MYGHGGEGGGGGGDGKNLRIYLNGKRSVVWKERLHSEREYMEESGLSFPKKEEKV